MEATNKNLKLLWWLRNIAILGASLAIKLAHKHYDLQLPYAKLCAIVALIGFTNFLTYFRLFIKFPVSNLEFLVQLLIDIFALAALIYLTGGASNPFATLFVLQVMIAATILSPIYSWLISLITITIYTALLYNTNETSHMHMMGDDFKAHIRGMWVNFIVLVLLVNWFITRMNITLRKKEAQLSENELMASLAAQSVNAAHQLGTPLGTISLLTESLDDEKAKIISEQVARCKEIIGEITRTSGAAKAESGKAIFLSEFIKSILNDWKKPQLSLKDITDYDQLNINIFSDYALKTAITNILDNAYDASPDFVEFNCFIKAAKIHILIRDHGKGINSEIAFGITSKQTGLGMGLYLSQATIKRLDGELQVKAQPSGGSLAQIIIPTERIKI